MIVKDIFKKYFLLHFFIYHNISLHLPFYEGRVKGDFYFDVIQSFF